MFVAEELYSQILQVMPIPCVDLLISDNAGNVLLLLRKNEPAADQWWFPGGRVWFGEKREDAAKRKLKEECGLVATTFQEIGTFDLFFNIGQDVRVHSITTLFRAHIARDNEIQIDHQSLKARWLSPHEWLKNKLHPFIYKQLKDMAEP
jgi:8-oxo-dGTP diphosphatase